MSAVSSRCDPFPGFKPGQVLASKYLLLSPLASGGMGQVWAARNLATGAEIAIKLLLGERSGATIARFRLEAHATAQLAHRSIVRVFDLVDLPDADGSLAIVMERLRGRTLAELLANEGPLDMERTLDIVLPILNALQYAHGLGTIHRDLKPENVFLAIEPDGAVIPKLVDFGVSKTLRLVASGGGAGVVVGTPSHMAPEQMRGDDVDARCDVFAAGILLHLCLTGRNPFVPADDSLEARLEAVHRPPIRPDQISPEVWKVLSRALAAREDDRFATAAELSRALVVAQSGGADSDSILPPRPSRAVLAPRPRLMKGVGQRLTKASIAASIVAVSIAAFGASTTRKGGRGDVHDVATRVLRVEPRALVAESDTLASAERVAPPFHAMSSRVTSLPPSRSDPKSFEARAAAYARQQRPKLLVLRDPGF
jgi:serine/threonine-protein kinase